MYRIIDVISDFFRAYIFRTIINTVWVHNVLIMREYINRYKFIILISYYDMRTQSTHYISVNKYWIFYSRVIPTEHLHTVMFSLFIGISWMAPWILFDDVLHYNHCHREHGFVKHNACAVRWMNHPLCFTQYKHLILWCW